MFIRYLPIIIALVIGGYGWSGLSSFWQDRKEHKLQDKITAMERESVASELVIAKSRLTLEQKRAVLLKQTIDKQAQDVKWAADRVAKRDKLVKQLRSNNEELDALLNRRIPSSLVR